MNNAREFDKVYTISVNIPSKGLINLNQNYYFDGYPFLRNIKVKAISVNNLPNILQLTGYLTLSDSKKNIILNNYPLSDLLLINQSPKAKLRLFKIDGVDLLNSYFSQSSGYINFSPTSGTLFNLNFYY
jgi:hypothetical protein